jgi:hypothetical protein
MLGSWNNDCPTWTWGNWTRQIRVELYLTLSDVSDKPRDSGPSVIRKDVMVGCTHQLSATGTCLIPIQQYTNNNKSSAIKVERTV